MPSGIKEHLGLVEHDLFTFQEIDTSIVKEMENTTKLSDQDGASLSKSFCLSIWISTSVQ